MNTLALGYVIPAIRAYSGLSPVRQCSCRAYNKKGRIPTTKLREQQPCQPLKYPSTSPRKERIPLTSFHPGLRDPSPQKPATPPSRKASERRWHPNKRDLSEGWQRTTTFQDQATFLPKSEAKGRGDSIPQKHFLFIQGSPITQVALNRWYKNERSPRNTHLDITTPKRNISLETS